MDRAQRRRQLRDQNLHASATYKDRGGGGGEDGIEGPAASAKLDGSLKKNSAMVSKLKSTLHFGDAAPKLCEELGRLKVQKFIAEMANAVCESALRLKSSADFNGWIEVASVLHLKSGEFLGPTLGNLLGQIAETFPAAKPAHSSATQIAEAASAKQSPARTLLRLLCEMTLCGLADAEKCVKSGVLATAGFTAKQIHADATLRQAVVLPGGIVYWLVRELLRNDSADNAFPGLPLLQVMARFYGEDFFGVGSDQVDADEVFIAEAVRAPLFALATDYFDKVAVELQSQHRQLQKMTSFNAAHQITRGDLTDTQKTRYETLSAAHERLLGGAKIIAEHLGFTMPTLADAIAEVEAPQAHIVDPLAGRGDADTDWTATPWEDEEQLRFYTDLPDLANLVPQSYLISAETTDKKKKPPHSHKQKQQTVNKSSYSRKGQQNDYMDDLDMFDDDSFLDDVDEVMLKEVDASVVLSEDTDETPGADTVPIALTRQAAVNAILTELPNLVNQSLIDKAAVEFIIAQVKCQQAARSKLIQTLLGLPRFRLDLIPYYARFIALLHPHMPEVGAVVLAALSGQFRRLYRKQHRIDLENRIKNVHFLGELAKFQVCPTHIIFYCMKRLTQPERSGSQFSSNHIEVAAHLLETCGRFMLKSAATGKMWSPLVDMFLKKVKQTVTDVRITLLVENAMLVADPPPPSEAKVKKEKPRTALEHYIRFLISRELNPRNVEKVLLKLRALPWCKKIQMELWIPEHQMNVGNGTSDGEGDANAVQSTIVDVDVSSILLKLFSKIWKVKYENIESMADLVSGLSEYYPQFSNSIVDNVLEQIRIGMEDLNFIQYQQRRVMMVIYLAELYCYKLVSSNIIFDTLYLLLCFGHEQGCPHTAHPSAIDLPDDYFRVRLVCTLLGFCSRYLDGGSGKRRLDQFFVYFQHYLLCKDSENLPIDIRFLIEDTFKSIRPSILRYETVEQAESAIAELEKTVFGEAFEEEYVESELIGKQMDADEDLAASSDDDVDDTDSVVSSNSLDSDGDHSLASSDTSHDSNEAVHAMYVPTAEEEEEFNKEFQKTMAESLDSRKNEKRAAILDVAIPMQLRTAAFSGESPTSNAETATSVQFTVLNRHGKGAKSTRIIHVPSSSSIVQSTLSTQEELRRERQRMKELVLDLEKTQSGATSGSNIHYNTNATKGALDRDRQW